ncbi:MAG: hypothetical protein ACHQNE_01490 [Candidatus Kapaibacterium sp.]
MKTLVLTLALTLAVSLGFTKAGFATGSIQFQISNQQADALGQVTVSTAGGDYYANVPGNSVVPVQIPDTAASVTINGQVVPQGQNATVTLATGKTVQVIWASANAIDIIDEGTIG